MPTPLTASVIHQINRAVEQIRDVVLETYSDNLPTTPDGTSAHNVWWERDLRLTITQILQGLIEEI